MRLGISVIVVVVLFLYLFNRFYGIAKFFDYTFNIDNIILNVDSLLGKGDKTATINFSVSITNNSPETIIFKNLIVKLYTPDGFEIGETPLDASNLKTTILNSGSKFNYTGSINVLINATTLNLMTAAMSGQTVTINYKLKVGLTSLGIPFTYSDSFQYKK